MENTQINKTEERENVKIGKSPKGRHFTTCKGCKQRINNFFRFCLPDESMTWNCQNCCSDYALIATENDRYTAEGHELNYLANMKQTTGGESKYLMFAVVDNEKFHRITIKPKKVVTTPKPEPVKTKEIEPVLPEQSGKATLVEAELVAKQLIKQHCPEFKFGWNNRKTAYGVCKPYQKKIELSKPLTTLNQMDEVVDTILHEIAHALTPGHHHDRVWKRKAIELGCRGERTSNKGEQLKGKYEYRCISCGRKTYTHRRCKRRFGCYDCCKNKNNNKFSEDYVCELFEVHK